MIDGRPDGRNREYASGARVAASGRDGAPVPDSSWNEPFAGDSSPSAQEGEVRHPLWLCLLVLAAGCAASRAPVRIISTDWATVSALGRGTEVGVRLEDGQVRYGRVNEVTGETLTLWQRSGRSVVPRARIERLTVRTAVGASRAPRIIQTALIGAAIGGTLAYLAGVAGENPGAGGSKWAVFFGGTALGAAIGSQRPPVERFQERVVYVRP
jgi:hypothetical protein